MNRFSTFRYVVFAAVATIGLAAPALCQTVPPYADEVSLAGPRFGATFLSGGVVSKLKSEEGVSVAPLVSQFGWQFEHQFYSRTDGPTALTEFVLLFGGLDQGIVIPSVTWMVGVRTHDRTEFGVGPNITPVGVALALAAGKTFRAGTLNVPVNLAVVPTRAGVRVSVLTGFSMRRR